jgi:hypothetical protein
MHRVNIDHERSRERFAGEERQQRKKLWICFDKSVGLNLRECNMEANSHWSGERINATLIRWSHGTALLTNKHQLSFGFIVELIRSV